MTEETFEGAGGLTLFARSWRPEGAARAVVVVNHGFMSHSGLYTWAAEQLVRRDFAVYALDMRGHGKSPGERYYVERFTDYVDDLRAFVTLAKSREPGVPAFLLGHSAGGVVSCMYALDSQRELSGLICESFAHEVPAPDFALQVLKGVSHIAPHAHVLKLKDEDFSRDAKFVAQMKTDPLIPHIGYPSQTAAELVRADERLKAAFGTITLPVLILHGTADRATKPSGSKRFYAETGSQDKTLRVYDGHYHDLLNDTDREVVMADIVEWLTMHVAQSAP